MYNSSFFSYFLKNILICKNLTLQVTSLWLVFVFSMTAQPVIAAKPYLHGSFKICYKVQEDRKVEKRMLM